MKNNKLFELLAQMERKSKKINNELITDLKDKIKSGMQLSKAVDQSIKEKKYFGNVDATIRNVIKEAACLGYGINADAVKKDQKKKDAFECAWAPDKMSLSSRLHGTKVKMRQAIIDTISTSIRKQKTLGEMSKALYDGYKNGTRVINEATLPKYMKDLIEEARRVANGDKKLSKRYEETLAIAEANLAKFAKRGEAGAPNRMLEGAYMNLIDAAKKLNAEAMDKAVYVAVQEKSRYHASRIARTESARAWYDGFIARFAEDESVGGYEWLLSSRHKYLPIDQCDVCANMNVGYGKGIYPKNMLPSIPRHPHCMCSLVQVSKYKVNPNGQIDPDKAREYIDSLSEDQQFKLFGEAGLEEYKKGKDWQQHLRGWGGFEKPASRFKPTPEQQELLREIDKGTSMAKPQPKPIITAETKAKIKPVLPIKPEPIINPVPIIKPEAVIKPETKPKKQPNPEINSKEKPLPKQKITTDPKNKIKPGSQVKPASKKPATMPPEKIPKARPKKWISTIQSAFDQYLLRPTQNAFNKLFAKGSNISKELQRILKNQPLNAKEKKLFDEYFNENHVAIDKNNPKVLYYDPDQSKIIVNSKHPLWKEYESRKALTHETIHMLDDTKGIIMAAGIAFLSTNMQKATDHIMDNRSKYEGLFKDEQYAENMSISDLFSNLTGNEIYGDFSHSKEYWNRLSASEKELVAALLTEYIAGDKASLQLIKEIPGLGELLERLVEIYESIQKP